MNSRFAEEKRHPPYYLLTGLILGLTIGLIVTMVVFPVQYSNVPPETLNTTDKDRYRLMIALAYQANQDLGRASARLGLLREEDVASQLVQQSRRSQSRDDAQILLNLAQAIQNPNPQPVGNQDLQTPTITVTDRPTTTASPTATTTPTSSPTVEITETQSVMETFHPTQSTPTITSTPSPTTVQNTNLAFQLIENQTICNPNYQDPLIQVEVFNAEGQPIPNTRIIVTWAEGQDTFYTGYYPDISLGYADFLMEPETTYNVRVGDIGELVTDLTAPTCETDDGTAYWGSIYLRFDAP